MPTDTSAMKNGGKKVDKWPICYVVKTQIINCKKLEARILICHATKIEWGMKQFPIISKAFANNCPKGIGYGKI
jgi:hypothetical protein